MEPNLFEELNKDFEPYELGPEEIKKYYNVDNFEVIKAVMQRAKFDGEVLEDGTLKMSTDLTLHVEGIARLDD